MFQPEWIRVTRRWLGVTMGFFFLIPWILMAETSEEFHLRKGYGPSVREQRIRPVESDEWLPNPHRGTATFQRFNGDLLYPDEHWNDQDGPVTFPPAVTFENKNYAKTTVAYCRWIWALVEPKEGEYHWDMIDGALRTAHERGQTLQIRIQPYVGRENIPSWYWDLGGEKDPKSHDKKGKLTWEIDHNDPLYLKHWGRLIQALGKRYDGHPDLESVDIAYGGSCGEMGGNATPKTAQKLVDIYLDSFQKTQLISMVGTPGCAYGSRFPRLGWRGDCFGDYRKIGDYKTPVGFTWNHMYDEYPHCIIEDGVADRWKTAPVILETCWTMGHWAKEDWDIDMIFRQGLKYHASYFMPKSCAIPEQYREKFEAFDRRLGYRFALRQALLPFDVKRGKKMSFNLLVENVGVAPIYHKYPVAIRFRQKEQEAIVPFDVDIREWLPGDAILHENIEIPEKFEDGEVFVDLAILDEKLEHPKVFFAMKEKLKDGWHPLTSIRLE